MKANNPLKETRWQIYKKLEPKIKKRFLEKISEEDSLKMLSKLYQFTYNLKKKAADKKLALSKIKTLAEIHSIFGKVEG